MTLALFTLLFNVAEFSLDFLPRQDTQFGSRLENLEMLGAVDLTESECLALAEELEETAASLNVLRLGFSSIGDEGAVVLATALARSQRSLRTLDLKYNTIEDAGAAVLTTALTTDLKSLESLDLCGESN